MFVLKGLVCSNTKSLDYFKRYIFKEEAFNSATTAALPSQSDQPMHYLGKEHDVPGSLKSILMKHITSFSVRWVLSSLFLFVTHWMSL